MNLNPIVVKAAYKEGFCIRLQFDDHSEKTVDFSRWLNGPVFEPLKDLTYFKRFFVEGGTVCWPNGADVAPETLFQA